MTATPQPGHGNEHPARLQVGISTPWDLWTLRQLEQRGRLAQIADSGIDFVFTADHVSFHDGSGMDGMISLAALSGLEPRLGLYLGVYLLALRHPVIAARQIATLAEAAPGRLTVGVGVGGEDRHEIEVCEIDPRTRGRRTDASLRLVRQLLDGATVNGDGEFFHFQQARIKPVPQPRVPFVVGGRSDAALRRAARHGDGWLAAWCTPDRFARNVATVQAEGEAAGRNLGGAGQPPWRHGLQLWAGIGDTPEVGRQHVATRMSGFYKLDFKPFERFTPTGTPQQVAEFLAPYVTAGASTICLATCGPSRQAEVEATAEIAHLLRAGQAAG